MNHLRTKMEKLKKQGKLSDFFLTIGVVADQGQPSTRILAELIRRSTGSRKEAKYNSLVPQVFSSRQEAGKFWRINRLKTIKFLNRTYPLEYQIQRIIEIDKAINAYIKAKNL